MQPASVAQLVLDLLVVLSAGLAAGVLCKRLGISVLVGYLLVGVLLGQIGFGLSTRQSPEIYYLAQAGALLLLFSIGIEFSLEGMRHFVRDFLLGGSLQMLLVAAPLSAVLALAGLSWPSAVLIGAAAALSSTVLVFRALEEWGQATSEHGRRVIRLLLFQDAALVPLMLLVPVLVGVGQAPGWRTWLLLGGKSVLFVAGVAAVRGITARFVVPVLSGLRSIELSVLFALIVLGGATVTAFYVQLPPALGALAAGMILNGNRLSSQFDALILPYRETFTAVFFVSLGSLMRLETFADGPLLVLGGLALILLLKTAAAAAALRLLGLRWRSALGMGLGLAQLGELAFVLLAEVSGRHLISTTVYNRMLFVAVGTLILTPQLLKTGLRWAGTGAQEPPEPETSPNRPATATEQALVVGLGPMGAAVASQLELQGLDVCLVDLSPVNLQRFAQQGFRTVAGDAGDAEILRHAGVENCRVAVVTVPDDRTAAQVVGLIRRLNPRVRILVRCRYQGSLAALRRAGANAAVSEEAEAAGALLRLLEP